MTHISRISRRRHPQSHESCAFVNRNVEPYVTIDGEYVEEFHGFRGIVSDFVNQIRDEYVSEGEEIRVEFPYIDIVVSASRTVVQTFEARSIEEV